MQRWNQFQDRFKALGVEMLAISPDTPDAVAAMRNKHGLAMRFLSDESLAVAERYNVKHDKAMAGDPRRKIFRPLVIPTTILVDPGGIVRWIDQTDDYRLRSDADRVLGAVVDALGV